jgi:CRISPR-associated protein Csa3
LKTLISTVFRGDVVKMATYRLSPDRLILFDSKEYKHTDVSEKGVSDIRKAFSGLPVVIERKFSKMYDIVAIASDVIDCIDSEHALGNEVILHISEGRKTQFIGMLLAAYARKEKVSGVYYLVEETKDVLALPLLSLKPSKAKLLILKEIAKGNRSVTDIVKKLGKTKGIVYIQIKELRADGFIKKEEMELTEVGRVSVK